MADQKDIPEIHWPRRPAGLGHGLALSMGKCCLTATFGPSAEAGVYRAPYSIGALYWASVSNPASPFVDMVSGAQGTAANEGNQPCPRLPPPPESLSSAARPG